MADVQIIRNVRNVAVAANEVITRFSVNRNFKKLLDNDLALVEFYKQVFDKLDIGEFVDPAVSGVPYEYDQIVWFQDKKKDLWLLRCIFDENWDSPQRAIDEAASGKAPNFRKYGWEDQNEYVDIFDSDLVKQFDKYAKQQLKAHVDDPGDDKKFGAHRFGKLSDDPDSPDFIEKKVMLRDVSNAYIRRKTIFFPHVTGYFTTDAITHGIYRVWDSGVLEFDLTFRVGWKGVNEDEQDVLSCNDMSFRGSTAVSPRQSDYNENQKYFRTLDDMKIFTNTAGLETYRSENARSVQGNRNKYVNTYFARLDFFPKPILYRNQLVTKFSDVNYMVFGGPRMANDGKYQDSCVGQSSNAMAWLDKTPTGITAAYITFPPPGAATEQEFEDFAKNGGIVSNGFSCHVIGRWDVLS